MKKSVTKSASKSETVTVSLSPENNAMVERIAKTGGDVDKFLNNVLAIGINTAKEHAQPKPVDRRPVRDGRGGEDLSILARSLYDHAMAPGREITVIVEDGLADRLEAMGERLCKLLDTGSEWGAELIVGAALRSFFRPMDRG